MTCLQLGTSADALLGVFLPLLEEARDEHLRQHVPAAVGLHYLHHRLKGGSQVVEGNACLLAIPAVTLALGGAGRGGTVDGMSEEERTRERLPQ